MVLSLEFLPSVEHVLGLEENIYCSALGMKGQMDMVLCGKYQGNSESTCHFPLELKTGKWRPSSSITHRAQVRCTCF